MELVELDAPDPVGVICPGDERFGRSSNVPEPEAAVVARRGQVVLLVGIEVQGPDHVVAGILERPDLLHGPDIPSPDGVIVDRGVLLAVLVRIPRPQTEMGMPFALQPT